MNIPGDTLKHHIKEIGETQTRFAERIGVVPSVLSRFISGHARPGLDTAFRIEAVTGGAVRAQIWTRDKKGA